MISSSGEAHFKNGTVGGWKITKNTLSATNSNGDKITLKKNGSISGPGWSINSGGIAHFEKIYGKVAAGHTIYSPHITIGGDSSGKAGSSISPNMPVSGNNGTLRQYVEKLAVGQLDAKTITADEIYYRWSTGVASGYRSVADAITSIAVELLRLNAKIDSMGGGDEPIA